MTHRKEAAIPTLWSRTIKGKVERGLGVKRTNGAQWKGDWAENSTLAEIRCTEEPDFKDKNASSLFTHKNKGEVSEEIPGEAVTR